MSGGLVGRVWAEFGGENSELKKVANDSINELNKVKGAAGAAGGEVSSAFGGIGNAALGLAASLHLIGKAVEAVKQVWEFAEEGAQIASLEQASYKLAKAYGANMGDIVRSVKEASFNTITEYDAMKSANLALTMGISTSASEISNLLQIAMERGRAFGLTTEEAFDRITRGIGRRSTKILDDLGFMTDAIRVNKEYAASLGISTSAMTDEMKVRALFLDILKQGNAELDAQGGLMMDVSTAYQKTGTTVKDFYNEVMKAVAYGALPFFANSEDIQNILKTDQAVSLLTGSYNDYYQAAWRAWAMKGFPGYTTGDGKPPDTLTKGQFTDAQRLTAMANAYKEAAGITAYLAEWTAELNSELALQVGLAGSLADAHEKYSAAMDKAGENTKDQAAAQNELNKSYNEFFLSIMGSLGMGTEAQMAYANSVGMIDDRSLVTLGVLGKLNEYYEQGTLGLYEMISAMKTAQGEIQGLTEDALGLQSLETTIDMVLKVSIPTDEPWYDVLTGEMKGGALQRTVDIAVNADTTTVETALNEISTKDWNALLTIDDNSEEVQGNISGLNGQVTHSTHYIHVFEVAGGGGYSGGQTSPEGAPYLLKHGGVVYGGLHGMVVPPGYSNDGMLVAVSSGERLEVTPAGNKTVDGGSNNIRIMGPVTFVVNKDIRQEDLISQLKL